MNIEWHERSVITANLLNPAFCGEIIKMTIESYTLTSGNAFPYPLAFLVLPIVLHKPTRESMPRTTATYFHSWIEEHEYLFIDFPNRAKNMVPYAKEAMQFLLLYDMIEVNEKGDFTANKSNSNKSRNLNDDESKEVSTIFRKATMLGKWLTTTGDMRTIYMFLKIRP